MVIERKILPSTIMISSESAKDVLFNILINSREINVLHNQVRKQCYLLRNNLGNLCFMSSQIENEKKK